MNDKSKLFRKNNILVVNISYLGKYVHWEFVDKNYNINELLEIYSDVLHYLVSGIKILYISQFFDEGQGLFITKDELQKIQREFHLQLYFTESYSKLHGMGGTKESYVVNLAGKAIPYWLNQITFFGGTSLSNIIIGFVDKDQIGKNEIDEMNRKFSSWYWLESSNKEIETLLNNSALVCWTSDSRLNTLLDTITSKSLMEYMKRLEQIYPIEFKIMTE